MSLLITLVRSNILEILGAMHIPEKESKEKMNLKVENFIAPAIALLRIVAWTYHTHFFPFEEDVEFLELLLFPKCS
jgi:hypothetical protein